MNNFEAAKALFLEGIDLLQKSKFLEAEIKFQDSLRFIPDRVSTLLNLSAAQIELNKFNEAQSVLSNVIKIDKDCAEAYLNFGLIQAKLKNFESAYQYFVDAIKLNPNYPEAWSNKGNSLNELKRFDEAIAAYEQAIKLNPNYPEAWSNKGNSLNELKRFDEAIAAYEQAIKLNPNYPEAWSNKGNSLNELKRFDEAIAAYEQAIKLNPKETPFLGNLLHFKMVIALWDSFANDLDQVIKKVEMGQNVSEPFPLTSLIDDPSLHLIAAKNVVNSKFPSKFLLPSILKNSHSKIRIGYFSADFKNHPVSFLLAELFEIHNRSRFETYAFSLQPAEKDDQMRPRLINAFNHFIDVENKSDLEIAQLSRDLEIDIAINLGGHTQHSRMGIFSYRAAPIQVNYLGYPGTLGADYIDYIIGDTVLIPTDARKFYTEKVVYLPNTYMVDDSTRQPQSKLLNKKDFGLPENQFIFCCFNNSYKFNPHILKSWARILHKIPNSVLWIPENNDSFKKNILKEFSKIGISSKRIIFAKYLSSMGEHLNRYHLADLFLDTLPFNAHTTAIDSLKAGVPILTFSGETFAGKVGASLLTAVNMPDLITYDQEAYEALAIDLARNPNKLTEIKHRLAENLLKAPLFNTRLFAKHLESAYEQMYQRYQMDLLPDHLFIN